MERLTPVTMILPETVCESLQRTGYMVGYGRTVARSQIAERFLEWGFPQFKQEALREGAKYLYRLRYDFLALPPSRPDWLTADTSAAKPYLFMLSWRTWRRLVNAIADSEHAGAYLSISDLFMLYFAWGWERFQRVTIGEEETQETPPESLLA